MNPILQALVSSEVLNLHYEFTKEDLKTKRIINSEHHCIVDEDSYIIRVVQHPRIGITINYMLENGGSWSSDPAYIRVDNIVDDINEDAIEVVWGDTMSVYSDTPSEKLRKQLAFAKFKHYMLEFLVLLDCDVDLKRAIANNHNAFVADLDEQTRIVKEQKLSELSEAEKRFLTKNKYLFKDKKSVERAIRDMKKEFRELPRSNSQTGTSKPIVGRTYTVIGEDFVTVKHITVTFSEDLFIVQIANEDFTSVTEGKNITKNKDVIPFIERAFVNLQDANSIQ